MWSHYGNENTGSLCGELRAARYLLIPLFVLGVAILALVIWQRLATPKRSVFPERNKVDTPKGAEMDGEAC